MLFTKDYFAIYQTAYFYKDVDALPRNKDTALLHFCAMICRSWTFERMTHDEKERCISTLWWTANQNALRGNFGAMWIVMQAVYNAFLSGLGCDGSKWREGKEE